MSTLSRREFFYATTLFFGGISGCRKSGSTEKPQATFEDSTKAFAEFLRAQNFFVDKKSIEEWQGKIKFSLNGKVSELVRKIGEGQLRDWTIKTDASILVVSFSDKIAITGSIKAQLSVGANTVYRLSSSEGEERGRTLGRSFKDGTSVVYENLLEEVVQSEIRGEQLSVGALSQRFRVPIATLDVFSQKIQSFIDAKPPSATEFVLLGQQIAQHAGVSVQNTLKMLLAIALFIRDIRGNNKFATDADKEKATKDVLYNVVLHELVHAQLRPKLIGDEEVFPITVELAFGKRPFHQLAAMMYMAVEAETEGKTEITRHGGAQANLLQWLQDQGQTPDRLLVETSEQTIHESGQQILHQLAMNNFHLAFAAVFDMTVLQKIEKFVSE
ncbi:hypothetical protein HZC07_01490 [Candidatus Micrarchaeota archaeon]|nr:hypothetical protein [Candidatus Micrarchaeota archaeon]